MRECTGISGDGEDAEILACIRDLKRQIARLERLAGKEVVVADGRLVTAYHRARPIRPFERRTRRRRRGAAMEPPDAAVDAVAKVIARAVAILRSRLSLRYINRMLERAEDLASRPVMH